MKTTGDSTGVENLETKPDLPVQKKNGWLKQVLAFCFAAILLWLTFRDKDLGEILIHLQKVDLFWVSMVCLSSLLSHVLRAFRWVIFLEPVAGRKVSAWNTFLALLICYSVNIVIPRGGEFVRLVTISKKENIPWAGALPTMFVDRLLDVAFLAIFTGITLPLLPDEILSQVPWLVPCGIGMMAASLAGLILLPRAAGLMRWMLQLPVIRDSKRIPEVFKQKIEALIEQFKVGTSCLTDWRAYPIVAALSVAIWVCYVLNCYFMLYAFGIQDKLDLKQLIVVFTLGSVGVLVPTPGNVGSFHAGTTLGLTLMTDVDPNLAAAYATLLHALTFVLLTVALAAVCMVADSFLKGRRSSSAK